jgi:hypothetical protein
MLKLPTMSWRPIKIVIAVDAVLDPVLLQYVSAESVSPPRWRHLRRVEDLRNRQD